MFQTFLAAKKTEVIPPVIKVDFIQLETRKKHLTADNFFEDAASESSVESNKLGII